MSFDHAETLNHWTSYAMFDFRKDLTLEPKEIGKLGSEKFNFKFK